MYDFHPGKVASDRRVDNRFIRILCKLHIASPDNLDSLYTVLSKYLETLNLVRFGIQIYTLWFHPSRCLGDPRIFEGVSKFPVRITRESISSNVCRLTIPLLYGYAPPAVIRVEYTHKSHKAIHSLLTIVKVVYYKVRCAGVETVLHQRDSALLDAVKQGLFNLPVEV